jgi:hypothetical protein
MGRQYYQAMSWRRANIDGCVLKSERNVGAAIAAEIVPLLREEAKKRQLAGLQQYHRADSPVMVTSPERIKGTTRDIAGKVVPLGA